ncbi:NADH-quinone oxidoreductase subunit J [Myxococcota bacterium]|nr:NADH-quinone oxidoreductase subunit J [Myxococcota bacterium]
MDVTAIVFYTMGALIVIAGLGVSFASRDSLVTCLNFLVVMLSTGVIFLLLDAPMIAVLQILVWSGVTGLAMVFAVMLVGRDNRTFRPAGIRLTKIAGGLLVVIVLAEWLRFTADTRSSLPPVPPGYGDSGGLGVALYTDYLLVVELVSLLLLATLVSALVLVDRKAGR